MSPNYLPRLALLTALLAQALPSSTGLASELSNRKTHHCHYSTRVHRTFVRRDVIEPGVYEIDRSPSSYGWVRAKVIDGDGSVHWANRRVLLRPYRNVSHFQRPYINFSVEHLSIDREDPVEPHC